MERVLTLVRNLIAYGHQLADTFQRCVTVDPRLTIGPFGTANLPLILACIIRGIHRARALEARLVELAQRPQAKPRPVREPSPRQPRPARPRVETVAAIPTRIYLPTPEEFAREVRRRPIGAVIADICRDFGIRTRHPLWREINEMLIQFRGNFAGLMKTIIARMGASILEAGERAMAAATAPPPVPSPAGGTGPP